MNAVKRDSSSSSTWGKDENKRSKLSKPQRNNEKWRNVSNKLNSESITLRKIKERNMKIIALKNCFPHTGPLYINLCFFLVFCKHLTALLISFLIYNLSPRIYGFVSFLFENNPEK